MRVITGASNVHALLNMYGALHRAEERSPRGQRTKNIRNMAVVMDGRWPILTSFEARKFNLRYAKEEWLWYLRADRFDDSIEQHATMWKKLKQSDGGYHSNYGQYIFGPAAPGHDPAPENMYKEGTQFEYAAGQLIQDKDTRKASMVLLNNHHLYDGNTDLVCTYAINFTIEDDHLHMTVMMRSNDAIFGFTNDAFCFSQLHTFMLVVLRKWYHTLEPGNYTHISNSMHVYERHFDMLTDLLKDGIDGYKHIEVPTPTFDEVQQLIKGKGVIKPELGAYSAWLAT